MEPNLEGGWKKRKYVDVQKRGAKVVIYVYVYVCVCIHSK